MKNVLKRNLAKQVVRWLLLVVIVVYVVTGFGITEYRVVESITFGLLTKPLAFKIHNNLLILFLVLLISHIYQGFVEGTRS